MDRLQAIATPLVHNMDKVQIIPPPKDIDPRILIWRGAAVLGKMDGVADLWVTPAEWVCGFDHILVSLKLFANRALSSIGDVGYAWFEGEMFLFVIQFLGVECRLSFCLSLAFLAFKPVGLAFASGLSSF